MPKASIFRSGSVAWFFVHNGLKFYLKKSSFCPWVFTRVQKRLKLSACGRISSSLAWLCFAIYQLMIFTTYIPLRTTSLTLTVSGLESVIIDGARNECLVIKDFSLQCILYRLEGAIKVFFGFRSHF